MLLPWFLLIGAVLVVMACAARFVDRLPLTAAVIYLAVGLAIGPSGLGMLNPGRPEQMHVIEALAEITVLISLFTVGLKLREPLALARWRLPLLLAGPGMVVGIALATLAAWAILGLAPAAALLVAAILSPTDPVLASDVQLRAPGERDAVRFALTAEGGMNDGTAFPAVMLALGFLGAHPLGTAGLRWFAVDVVWAITGGVAIGWACGAVTARLVDRLRGEGDRFAFEEFLVLGVIALAYGAALAAATYGFLAVFAAGLAFRQFELGRTTVSAAGSRTGDRSEAPPADDSAAELASRLLTFTEQAERLAEVAVVLVVGACIALIQWSWALVTFVVVMLILVRPLTVLSLPRGPLERRQRALVMWFGIRGVGSIYYLAFALGHGVPAALGAEITSVVIATVVVSVVVHGVSATPLMDRYQQRMMRRRNRST
jgi:NhaP-type Na+/H+ or K+/H+ antiporter